MVSNFPGLFPPSDEIRSHLEQTAEVEGLGERMLDRIREAFCGLHGHDNLLQFKHDRMFLKCVSCGHESPGWELNETPPTVVAQVENHMRQPLIRPQLVDVRRIA
jgi:hypothetical protein